MGNGDLPPPRPDQAYHPPPGGQAVSGQRSVVRARTVIISGTGTGAGLFVYSPTPGAGNLTESITAADGFDPYGNATLAGYTTYNNSAGTFFATNISGAQFTEWTATSQAGPYTFNGGIAGLSTSLPIGVTTTFPWQFAATGNTMAGSGTDNNPVLALSNFQLGGSPLLLSLISSTAGDNVIRTRLNADINDRWHIDDTGRMAWGTGSSTPNTALFFAGTTGQLVADSIAARIGFATAETWHAPTFQNGWTNSATLPNLQYRLVCAPYNCAQWVGNIVIPVGFAAGQAVTSTLTAAYKPANPQQIIGHDITANIPIRFQVGTGGALLYEGPGGVAGDTIAIPAGQGLYSLDA